MIDREKVIKALECCRGYCDDETGCPYFGTDDDCEERMKDDAVALLKAQEPRVMTLKEVKNTEPGTVVWLEDYDKPTIVPGIVVFVMAGLIDFQLAHRTARADYDEYCERWRCWNSCPTDEQRKEVEWNGWQEYHYS